MSRLVSFLAAMWLSTASGQFGFLDNLSKGVQKEVQSISDPVKNIAGVGSSQSSPQLGFLDGLARDAQKEVQSISDPVVKTIAAVGSSQCNNVKKIIGVDYQSYDGEPDLSQLTLNFITRAKNVTYNLTDPAAQILESGWFNPKVPLKIYFHGFTDDPTKDSYKNISNAFLVQGDFNILALDASSCIRWLYLRSTTMVQFIGIKLAKVLAAMVHAGLDPSAIHLIGHSLGSHIAGFTGQTFRKLTGLLVGRISGLDPAGPCFSDVNVTLRLSSDDAAFVDVVHTDAGVYGIEEQVGHVDFYPNSGSQQPNCLFQTCSHSRAWLIFAESVVNPNAFLGVSCSSWKNFRNGSCDYDNTLVMGLTCPVGATGKYYLQTNEDIPYGRWKQGIRYENNDGVVRNLANVLT